MKTISLWQPWASLWCSKRKVHETRHWPTHHRGWIVVHAAKRFETNFAVDDPLRMILDDEFGGQWEADLPAGALIGVVNVVACKRTEDVTGGLGLRNARPEQCDDYRCGDFTDGRYAWERREFRVFERPIPYRGAQGIFNVPDVLIGMDALGA
jgi:hypothetical protein